MDVNQFVRKKVVDKLGGSWYCYYMEINTNPDLIDMAKAMMRAARAMQRTDGLIAEQLRCRADRFYHLNLATF